MQEFKEMKTAILVDMLSWHTNEYLQMLKLGTTEAEYQTCKDIIAKLITEIESRKQERGGISGINHVISFTK